MTPKLPGNLLLAAILFFMSGALGLGYELVWIRKAALVVGSSQIALSTVLTSFFMGLGLGSFFVGRYLRSRRWSPLFVYGIFEAAIGVFALAFPWLFEVLEAAYAGLFPLVANSGIGLFFVRFILLFAFLLVPTFFMGGTLPLLLDGLVERDRSIGSLTSLFYGLNILGAVLGVLATGYFAIPYVGMNGTSIAAGFGNLCIAALALVFFRGLAPLHPPPERPAASPGPDKFFAVLSFLSGMAAIGYQVAWARYFGLVNRSSVYLTAIILAVFLLALSSGSMLLAPVLRKRIAPLRLIALLQPLVVLFVFFGLEWWRAAAYELVATDPPKYYEVEASWHLISEVADSIFFAPLFQVGLVLFIPVALLGTTLPALIAAATRKSEDLRSISGTLVFWNTLGSSAGGFVAGYLLIPGLGLRGALFEISLISLALAIGAEWKHGRESEEPGRSRKIRPPVWLRPGYVLTVAALVAGYSFLQKDLIERTIYRFGLGLYAGGAKLIDIVEGPLTTAYIFESASHFYLASGHVFMAAISKSWFSPQALGGHVPAIFYPKPGTPERCLGIGMGSGQAFGALLLHPIKTLDVVDISSEIKVLSLKHFEAYNHALGKDKRVNFWLDDGRHFVDRTPDSSYDIVSMEPPPPTTEGVYSLYSLEFYKGVRRILSQDGVLMQMLPMYELTPKDVQGIVKTQATVFPYTFIIKTGQIDFVLLSFKTDSPPRWSREWLEERAEIFERERLVKDARWNSQMRYEIASVMGILSLIISGPEDIARMEAPLLYRDDFQRLNYTSGDRQLLRRYGTFTRLLQMSFATLPLTSFRNLQKYFLEAIPWVELDEERARSLAGYGVSSPARVAQEIEEYSMESSPSLKATRALRLALIYDGQLVKDKAYAWIEGALSANPMEQSPWAVGAVTQIVQNKIGVYNQDVERWIDSLSDRQRTLPLVQVIESELGAYKKRERERRSRYLFN